MKTIREVASLYRSRPTIEGAGVHLKRAVGWGDPYEFDPFLLLDDFHSRNPADYVAGFPWHPHRGIETVTYMLEGVVAHGDSIGNRGEIRSGDVQWMTAGGGIVHQEMPQPHEGDFRGTQLWVNLPRSHKMMEPRYRGIEADQIPECRLENGALVKVIAGRYGECVGPVTDLVLSAEYLDVTLPVRRAFAHPTPPGHTCFAYVLTGEGFVGSGQGAAVSTENVVLFGPGDSVAARAGADGMRFLLLTGEPLGEPIAWRGPIVMNTEEELDTAWRELREGTFLKQR
jgi:redox-sensitive bicupin YhaK (pirin superfamily)